MPRRKANPHATRAKEPARDVNRTQKQLKAIELRKQGYEWQQIAEICGINGGKSGAYKLVNQALKTSLREAAEDYRELLAQRLDALWQSQFEKAMDPNNKDAHWAADRCLQIIDRQERLFGLAIKNDASAIAAAQVVIREYPLGVSEAV